MKKVILSFAMMLILMSFTKSSNIQDKEELFSPECFEYADRWTKWRDAHIPFKSVPAIYDYWVIQYDDCESQSNNDAFQFPEI